MYCVFVFVESLPCLLLLHKQKGVANINHNLLSSGQQQSTAPGVVSSLQQTNCCTHNTLDDDDDDDDDTGNTINYPDDCQSIATSVNKEQRLKN